jgi:rubrerythrin
VPQPATGPAAEPAIDDAAIVDLLGALAYGELSAFDRLADDARLAPTLDGRAQMSAMAAVEMGHYRLLAERLETLGVAPPAAMEPFVAALETYHAMTEPQTWLEGVVKAFAGDGMAADFYRAVAEYVDEPTRSLIHEVLADAGRAEFAVREVRTGIETNPAIAGRLALWARRLVGEAISQTQHVLADRDALMLLLMKGSGDLAGVAGLVSHITARHEERMVALGLSR